MDFQDGLIVEWTVGGVTPGKFHYTWLRGNGWGSYPKHGPPPPLDDDEVGALVYRAGCWILVARACREGLLHVHCLIALVVDMVPHVRRKDCELGGGTLGPHMRFYTGGAEHLLMGGTR